MDPTRSTAARITSQSWSRASAKLLRGRARAGSRRGRPKPMARAAGSVVSVVVSCSSASAVTMPSATATTAPSPATASGAAGCIEQHDEEDARPRAAVARRLSSTVRTTNPGFGRTLFRAVSASQPRERTAGGRSSRRVRTSPRSAIASARLRRGSSRRPARRPALRCSRGSPPSGPVRPVSSSTPAKVVQQAVDVGVHVFSPSRPEACRSRGGWRPRPRRCGGHRAAGVGDPVVLAAAALRLVAPVGLDQSVLLQTAVGRRGWPP
jgi:hypothetical protein